MARSLASDLRLDVPNAELLEKLISEAPPLDLRAAPTKRAMFREVYYDTPDKDLQRRGVACTRMSQRSSDAMRW